MTDFSDRDNNQGFSLIETAIVLTIIGLLVAATLGGQALLKSAQLQAVIDEIQTIQGAIYNFQNKFGQLPGSFNNASAVFGCTAGTVPMGCDGNDYGYIDDSPTTGQEPARVWQHLALAAMIQGNYSGTTDAKDYYTSKFRNGKYATYQIQPSTTDTVFGRSGWVITLGQYISSSVYPQGPLFQPIDLQTIDLKMDDGIGYTGLVYGVDGYGVPAGDCTTAASNSSGSDYNVGVNYSSCYLVYWMQ